MQTVKRNLLYKFSSLELKVIAQEMAIRVEELDKVEEEKKAVNDGFKAKIDTLKGQIRGAAHKINTGQEQRLIDCRVDKDFATNQVRVVRLDTQEVVEERALTPDERQQMMEFKDMPPPQGPEGESATVN